MRPLPEPCLAGRTTSVDGGRFACLGLAWLPGRATLLISVSGGGGTDDRTWLTTADSGSAWNCALSITADIRSCGVPGGWRTGPVLIIGSGALDTLLRRVERGRLSSDAESEALNVIDRVSDDCGMPRAPRAPSRRGKAGSGPSSGPPSPWHSTGTRARAWRPQPPPEAPQSARGGRASWGAGGGGRVGLENRLRLGHTREPSVCRTAPFFFSSGPLRLRASNAISFRPAGSTNCCCWMGGLTSRSRILPGPPCAALLHLRVKGAAVSGDSKRQAQWQGGSLRRTFDKVLFLLFLLGLLREDGAASRRRHPSSRGRRRWCCRLAAILLRRGRLDHSWLVGSTVMCEFLTRALCHALVTRSF